MLVNISNGFCDDSCDAGRLFAFLIGLVGRDRWRNHNAGVGDGVYYSHHFDFGFGCRAEISVFYRIA